MTFETNYKHLIHSILKFGDLKQGRNGQTTSLFGQQLEITTLLANKFPIISGRQIYYGGVIGEMAAFLSGVKSVEDFKRFGCNYWDDRGDNQGNLNVDYGNSWLNFNGVNQIQKVVDSIKNEPNSRRHLITGWNPANIDTLSLPCCHYSYQFYVSKHRLDLVWVQRSVDVMVGLPRDIILAALLLILMANETGYLPGKIIMQFGDCHIYKNHLDQVNEYLTSVINDSTSYRCEAGILDFLPKDFKLIDYDPSPAIEFKLNI